MSPEVNELVARMALSRQRLHQALQPGGRAAQTGDGAAAHIARAWWHQHPLHLAGVAVASAGHAVLQPMAQAHPLRLVGVAMLVGAVLAFSRPWRWMSRPMLLGGLVPQLLIKVAAMAPSPTRYDAAQRSKNA